MGCTCSAKSGSISWDSYRDGLSALGRPAPGPLPEVDRSTVVLDDDPQAAWDEMLPYFVHEATSYAKWLDDAGMTGPFSAATPEEIRNGDHYRVLRPEEFIEFMRSQAVPFSALQPMVGGAP